MQHFRMFKIIAKEEESIQQLLSSCPTLIKRRLKALSRRSNLEQRFIDVYVQKIEKVVQYFHCSHPTIILPVLKIFRLITPSQHRRNNL